MRIGCCGWNYLMPKKLGLKDWKKRFKSKLQLYASLFDTVEVNSTFYKLPKVSTAKRLLEEALAVNKRFEFSVKAFKGITHVDKFTGKSLEYWEQTREIAEALEAKFILIQTPASFKDTKENIAKVKKFFDKVAYDHITIELRGFSQQTIDELCEEYGLIQCVDPFAAKPRKQRVYYFRLHGKPPGKKMYYYQYKDSELRKLAKMLPKRCYVYFNNIYMCEDALRFKKIVGLS